MPNETETATPETPEGNAVIVTGVGALDAPKSSQILLHGQVWALEPAFHAMAMEALDGISIADAITLQAKFDANREAENLAANARRKANGEPDPKPYLMEGSTAIIPVKGVMTKKPTSARAILGGTSTIETSSALRSARKDPDVNQIFMWFETPGGEAAGCAEFADEVRATNAVKPVIGFISDQCASAGMFPASQCSALFMNRMGRVGCVSTLWVVHDTSAQAAMRGVEVTAYVSDGATYKGMLTPGTKLTKEQEKHVQEMVNHFGDDFKATVQMGRGLTDDQMKVVQTAKMFSATEAIDLGLIDGILSYEECLSQVSAGKFAVSPTTDEVPNPVRAELSATNGDTMTFEEVKAWLSGQSPEARRNAGINLEEIQQQKQAAAVDAKVAEHLAGIAKNQAEGEANAFADDLIRNAKATKAEKDGIVAVFVNALNADGGGAARFENGRLIEGANVASLKAAYASRPAHPFLNQTVGDLDKGGNFVQGGNGGVEVLDRATMKDLLSRTEEGRNAWAKFEKGKVN